MKLVFLVAIAVGLAAPTQAGLVDDFFMNAFNQLRPKLKELYIPLFQDKAGKLTLVNVFADGLDKFYSVQLSVNLIPLAIKNMTLMIDDIVVEGRYKMQGMALPGGISLTGAGNLRMGIQGLRLYVKATCTSRAGKVLIKDVQELEVTVNAMQINMENLGGGGAVSELLNEVFNMIAVPLLNAILAPMLMANEAGLIENINKVLAQIDV